MNYTYEIQIASKEYPLLQPIVKEKKYGKTSNLWTLSTLLDSYEIKSDSSFTGSLMRTKKWLKENHPEIIMKFLIFGDGVYDRNDIQVIFWKFSELSKMPTNEKDSKMISFKRTKDWILDNYPELMI